MKAYMKLFEVYQRTATTLNLASIPVVPVQRLVLQARG